MNPSQHWTKPQLQKQKPSKRNEAENPQNPSCAVLRSAFHHPITHTQDLSWEQLQQCVCSLWPLKRMPSLFLVLFYTGPVMDTEPKVLYSNWLLVLLVLLLLYIILLLQCHILHTVRRKSFLIADCFTIFIHCCDILIIFKKVHNILAMRNIR